MRNSFKDLTYEELVNKRIELTKEYRDLRFNLIVGHVENPLKKRILKRSISRLNTIIHEYDTGKREK